MISLDDCYQKYQGQSVLVDNVEADRGQCVQWADVVISEVYGLPYHYGNAIDWWYDPRELLTENFEKITDGSVKKGDFVIFNTQVGSVYGHIDVAMQDGTTANFQGADSNWGGNKTVHLVQHTNANYVIGSLRRGNMSTIATSELVDSLAHAYLNDSLATNPGLKFYVGQPVEDVIHTFNDSTERGNYLKSIEDLKKNVVTRQAVEDYINKNLQ